MKLFDCFFGVVLGCSFSLLLLVCCFGLSLTPFCILGLSLSCVPFGVLCECGPLMYSFDSFGVLACAMVWCCGVLSQGVLQCAAWSAACSQQKQFAVACSTDTELCL